MKQHVAHDQIAVRYADAVDHVWAAWEPAMRRCERLLGGQAWRSGTEPEQLATELRRVQYRAHAASEFAAGLVPPPSAIDAHAVLVGTLASCRDALGVIALRAELDELDADASEIGLHAVDMTSDAFRGARSSTALVHAWIAEDQVDPEWLSEPSTSGRGWQLALWLLVATCVALFVVLALEVLVLRTS